MDNDLARQSVYNRLVVKCERKDCKASYQIKNRNKHLKKCESFVQFRCKAPICKIIESKYCLCENCKDHDCYALTKWKPSVEEEKPVADEKNPVDEDGVADEDNPDEDGVKKEQNPKPEYFAE